MSKIRISFDEGVGSINQTDTVVVNPESTVIKFDEKQQPVTITYKQILSDGYTKALEEINKSNKIRINFSGYANMGNPGYTPIKGLDYFDGLSAYQLAVEGGYEGTLEEFKIRLSLVGESLISDNETIELIDNKISVRNKDKAPNGGVFMKRDGEFTFKQSLDGGLF